MRTPMLLGAAAVAFVAAACGSSSSTTSTSATGSSAPPATTGPAAGSGAVKQGGTMLLASSAPEDTWDGQAYYGKQWQVEYLTSNCLVDPKPIQAPGAEQFQAGIATSIPTPTNGGKTYTFTIRSGLKYSDGTPVQASDVKAYFERALDPGMGYQGALGSGYYNGIVGMDKYAPAQATKAGAKSITGITVSGQNVTFNLTAPDPDFTAKLSLRFVCPQKPGGPHKRSQTPQPSTGPYMVTAASNTGLTLVRNPNWWSNAAILGLSQYKGKLWNVDGFNFTIGTSVQQELLQLKANQIDMAWIADAVASLAQRVSIQQDPNFSSRFHLNLDPFVREYEMNVTIPPFNNLKVRMAANYAVNRTALVQIDGEGLPWDNIMSQAQMPNTKPGSLFPLTADQAKAKALLAASGLPLPIKLPVRHGPVPPAPAVAAALESQLTAVGFQTSDKGVPPATYYQYAAQVSNKNQLMSGGWSPDWIDGSSALGPKLAKAGVGGNNLSENADPAFEAAFSKIDAMPYGPARSAAWEAFAVQYGRSRVPWIPWNQDQEQNLLSTRVGGFTYDPTHLVNMATLYLK